jgi:uncharacterized protein
MKSKGTRIRLLIVLISFAAFLVLLQNFGAIKSALDGITRQGLVSYILTYILIGAPVFAGTWLADRKTNLFQSLGLSSGLLTGLWAGLLFTAPMFLGGLLFFHLNTNIDIENLIAGTLVAGFMEELYFRGFLFGILFRKTGMGFIPAVLAGALLFAAGHVYQSRNPAELAGIFAITFSAAVFFAWLYAEWNYRLWVVVWTHTLMNLSWSLFDVDQTALGNITANIFRGLTIATAILFTVFYKRHHQRPLTVNKHTLFIKT